MHCVFPVALALITQTPAAPLISPDAVLSRPTGVENAAVYYVSALNSYQARRTDRPGSEPPILATELHAIALGASQSDCDLHVQVDGKPVLAFTASADRAPLAFVESTDPRVQHPYVTPLGLMAQAALNEGKRREALKRWAEAIRIYRHVARMGWHLRRHPTSMSEIELSLRIERTGLHYLRAAFSRTRSAADLRAATRYVASTAHHQAAVRRKFAGLGNADVATRVARTDPERLWRIEALAALAITSQTAPPGHATRLARKVLAEFARDDDPLIRESVRCLSDKPARLDPEALVPVVAHTKDHRPRASK